MTARLAAPSSSTISSVSSTRASGMPAPVAMTRRALRPERPGWKPEESRSAPTRAAGARSSRYRLPRMVTDPAEGRTRSRIMRRVVVLPAPLGPRTPVIVPDSIVKLTSSTARTFLPNRLVRCSAWMTAGMLPPGRAVVGRVRARPSLHEDVGRPVDGRRGEKPSVAQRVGVELPAPAAIVRPVHAAGDDDGTHLPTAGLADRGRLAELEVVGPDLGTGGLASPSPTPRCRGSARGTTPRPADGRAPWSGWTGGPTRRSRRSAGPLRRPTGRGRGPIATAVPLAASR